ncbi:MAG: glycosyltransferase family 9 protein, partial [Cyanobacteria bacterium]|nr:glycosyltransferase family 9 protein [Cyanobacteriota bacterium]
ATSPNPINLTLWTTPEDEIAIETLLALHHIPPQSKLAGLHLVSASHGKFFAVEKFIEPVQALHQEGYTLITTGLESDVPIYEKLAEFSGVPLVNWAGLTSLRETAALFKKLSILITVDSSPIHLACATHVPKVLGVFGPTNEKQWGIDNPRIQFQPVFLDLSCRPCYAKICEHNSCRVDLTGADILAGLKTLLNSAQTTPV